MKVAVGGSEARNFLEILPDRFLPPPIPFVKGDRGPMADANGNFGPLSERLLLSRLVPASSYQQLPFDLYCPSIHKSVMSTRICKLCHLYLATKSACDQHRRLYCSIVDDTEMMMPRMRTLFSTGRAISPI